MYGKFQLLKVNIVKAFHRNDLKFSTAIALVQFFLINDVIINIIMNINEMENLKHCNLIPFEDIYRKFLVESFFHHAVPYCVKIENCIFLFFLSDFVWRMIPLRGCISDILYRRTKKLLLQYHSGWFLRAIAEKQVKKLFKIFDFIILK